MNQKQMNIYNDLFLFFKPISSVVHLFIMRIPLSLCRGFIGGLLDADSHQGRRADIRSDAQPTKYINDRNTSAV